MFISQLDHLNLTVRSFDDTLRWYRGVFSFELVEEGVQSNGVRWGVIRSGDAMLCIYEAPKRRFMDSDKLGRECIHGIAHFGLRVADREAWQRALGDEALITRYGEVTSWRYPHSMAWYVTDPTGYEIEVVLWDDDKVRFDHAAASVGE